MMYQTKEERAALFDVLGKYTEIELLNKRATGFGWAVLVQDNFEGQRQKVIKLPNSESATRELLVEAEILTKISRDLRHPNLVELMSVDKYPLEWQGKKDDRWFLVLQFGGSNLRSRLGRLGMKDDEYVYMQGRPLPLEETLNIALQVTDGLKALHEFEESPGQHIIHRDIKPENILIDRDGQARVTDFGISKVVERLTQSVTAAGTPPYLAPEYSRGRLHACSDIYSWGIVLYEMATGTFPFRTLQDRFYEMPTAPHLVNADVPPGLSDVIMRCLAWDPSAHREEEKERYQFAADLLDDLRGCERRLYPVPPRFEKKDGSSIDENLYVDVETQSHVRVILYEATQPSLCTRRLSFVQREVPQTICPVDTFDADETVGIVTPLPPQKPTLPNITFSSSEDIYQFVGSVVGLCNHVENLHRLGIYHGFLSPLSVLPMDDGSWWIDNVWAGQLTGLVTVDQLLGDDLERVIGFLAPEILEWKSPPTLSSDLYGIGSILFGCVTGIPPIAPEAAREMTQGAPVASLRGASGVRDRAPLVTRRLETIITRLLQPDPLKRYRSMEELLDDLRSCRWPADVVDTYINDALEAQKQNRVLDGYRALDEALKVDPGNWRVHHARAEIYFLEDELDWAMVENEKAIRISPTASVLLLQAQCLMGLDELEKAEAFFRRSLDAEETFGGRHLLGKCLERSGKHQRALDEYRQAVQIAEGERNTAMTELIKADISALMGKMGS